MFLKPALVNFTNAPFLFPHPASTRAARVRSGAEDFLRGRPCEAHKLSCCARRSCTARTALQVELPRAGLGARGQRRGSRAARALWRVPSFPLLPAARSSRSGARADQVAAYHLLMTRLVSRPLLSVLGARALRGRHQNAPAGDHSRTGCRERAKAAHHLRSGPPVAAGGDGESRWGRVRRKS